MGTDQALGRVNFSRCSRVEGIHTSILHNGTIRCVFGSGFLFF